MKYRLSDNCIVQIVRLVQLGILTGTDISDQLRLMEVQPGENDMLVPTPSFMENFENNIQRLSQEANNTTQTTTDGSENLIFSE